jgi:hypothetical protein
MGDKSPQSNRKKAGQKQAKVDVVNHKKRQATADKQAGAKKK